MPRHPVEGSLQRLTLRQISGRIGRSPRKTAKLICRFGFLPEALQVGGTYDQRLVHLLLWMLGDHTEQLVHESADWLTLYLSQGDPHA